MKIVEEEVDESLYWLELFKEILPEKKSTIIKHQKKEKELLAIIVASINSAKANQSKVK